MKRKGYGVLASDSSREVTRDFTQEIESRLVLHSPKGDGSVLTLVTLLGDNGAYTFRVEDENRNAIKEVSGNLFAETRKERVNE